MNSLKRIRRRATTLFLLTSLIMAFVFVHFGKTSPYTTMSVDPLETMVPSCTTFDININVTDVYELMGVEFWLSYNTTLLDALDAIVLPPFLPSHIDVNDTAGYVHVAAELMPQAPPISGDVIIATITFHCTGAGGSVLDLHDTLLIDPYGIPIPHDIIDGFVTQTAFYWKPGVVDYAPSGLPDFDQRQDNWTNPQAGKWSYCGPTALANSFWWLDSFYEPGNVTPPTISDGFGLVKSYNATWDDHDPRNVPPLIEDLALYVDTDGIRTGIAHNGTYVDDMEAGINWWLVTHCLDNELYVKKVFEPTFEYVEYEVERCEDVILLLGFYQFNESEPDPEKSCWRIGGHYVTVAGVDSVNMLIAFSDPALDFAEPPPRGMNWTGRVLPPPPHPHNATPPYPLHNNATYVCHDQYGYANTSGFPCVDGVWGPARYEDTWTFMENCCFGQNGLVTGETASGVLSIINVTTVEYAIIVSPTKWFWKSHYVDYSPSGVPDFDQHQKNWTKCCAPTAVANSLWWMDSRFEPGNVTPPTISDGFRLVQSYNAGVWDDHDPRNVQPFIEELAGYMDTNGNRTGTPHNGTDVYDMEKGIDWYLGNKSLSGKFYEETLYNPTFQEVEDEVEKCEDVILIIVFMQITPQFDCYALGAHAVTVAGVNSEELMIAFSDPGIDNAEPSPHGNNGTGRVIPPPPHGHPANGTIHNNASFVSHDIYKVNTTVTFPCYPGVWWGPINYATNVTAFALQYDGQNIPKELLHLYNPYVPGSVIVPIVTHAVTISPKPPVPKITYRLLAIEGFYKIDMITNGTDYPMQSAQYLIQNLLSFSNWQNTSTGGFNYTSYVHLLSYAPNAPTLPYYRGPPTNSNVVSEIKNFLGQTLPGEDNSFTVRIFYYVGHSDLNRWLPNSPFYLQLSTYCSHPANFLPGGIPQDPKNPSHYEELYDHQLSKLFRTGGLGNSNCTLIILDSCYSGGFSLGPIPTVLPGMPVPRTVYDGRIKLAACKSWQKAFGWDTSPPDPPPGNWSIFTGLPNALYSNGTQFGPLGIIGGLWNATDLDKDGWLSVGEIFPFARTTTPSYTQNEWNVQQVPQATFGVKGGRIPLVQKNASRPFPRNAPPCYPYKWKPKLTAWPMFRCGANRTGTSPAAGPGTSLLWDTQLSDSVFGSVVVVESQAIVTTTDGVVHDLDLRTGETLWTFTTTDSPIYSTPAVIVSPSVEGIVFVGTLGGGGGWANGTLYALDENTGLMRWNFTTPPGTGGIFASPAVADGMVFIATMGGGGGSGGCVYALNATTGQQLWYFQAAGPIKSSPAVADNGVYVATMGGGGGGGGCVYALDEFTGTPVWPSPFETDSPVISTPAVAGGMVFIATMGGGGGSGGCVYALDEFTGTPLWNYTTTEPITSSPAVDPNRERVIVGSDGPYGMIYALKVTDGSPDWMRPIGTINMSSPAISSNGYVYIGATNSSFYCLNETNGEKVWSYNTGGPILSSPALTDDHVLIGSMDGKVYCFGPPFPVHDVAVLDVDVSRAFPWEGEKVEITYSVRNKGNVPETFNVTIAYLRLRDWISPLLHSPTVIHIEQVTLQSATNLTKTYEWDTSGLSGGTYLLFVIADVLPGEINSADNTYRIQTITVRVEPLRETGGLWLAHKDVLPCLH